MAEFSDYLENEILDHVFRNAAYTPVATVYLSLHTTVSSDSAAGTEVSGSGYARQSITFNAASGGVIDNSNVVSFTASGGNFGTVVGVAIFDALTVGNMLAFDNDMADVAVNDGDTLQFPAGNITVSLT